MESVKHQIEYKRLDEIRPYDNNPRRNDEAAKAVANSIKEFGFQSPIIVDRDGVIIAGHTRYKAARRLKLQEVPVIVAAELDPEKVKALRIADNSTGEVAEWDLQLLVQELTGIEYDMTDFGLNLQIKIDEEVKEDDFTAEPPEQPITQRGDIWLLGDHRVMCGDSTSPQDVERLSHTNTEGIDIMLAIDVSGSMLARDFRPDRITAAKEVAGSFIADRYGDRIGLVAFAGEAFTQSPLTTDQGTLQTLLSRIRSGLIEDGTAIGNGLATAINRLRESEAKSKVIILLTDGVNNRGEIAPLTAAEIAKAQGIRVYTIGVGTEGMAPYPAVDIYGTPTGGTVMAKVEIDEKTLRSIAEMTGGEYFRATDKAKLKAIYDQINQLEKSKVEVTEHVTYHEQYLLWALAGLLLLFAEFLFANLVLKRIP